VLCAFLQLGSQKPMKIARAAHSSSPGLFRDAKKLESNVPLHTRSVLALIVLGSMGGLIFSFHLIAFLKVILKGVV